MTASPRARIGWKLEALAAVTIVAMLAHVVCALGGVQ